MPTVIRRWSRHSWRVLATLIVLLAIGVTLLRGAFTFANEYRDEIVHWITQDLPVSVEVGVLSADLEGYTPVFVLNDIVFNPTAEQNYRLKVGRALLELDWLASIRQRRLVFDNLTFDHIDLAVPWFGLSGGGEVNTDPTQALSELFLERLDHFSVTNSTLTFEMPNVPDKYIYVESLRWLNREGRHQGNGQAFLVDSAGEGGIDFTLEIEGDPSQIRDLKGRLFAQGEQVNISPIAELLDQSSLTQVHTDLNFSIWGTFGGGAPLLWQLEWEPSTLDWRVQDEVQRVDIHQGRLQLVSDQEHIRLDSFDWALSTNGQPWPELKLQGLFSPEQYQVAIERLDLSVIAPLAGMLPGLTESGAPSVSDGALTDLRFNIYPSTMESYWEANLNGLTSQPWLGTPGVVNLNGSLWGDAQQFYFDLAAQDSQLDFDQQFPEPWSVNQLALSGRVHWSKQGIESQGYRLLLDTPELNLKGRWNLVFHQGARLPWLGLYGQADVKKAVEAPRYFPSRLHPKVVSYLSNAIVAGEATQAQLLWNGYLEQYPFKEQQGIFQVFVPLQHAEFAFYKNWQPLTDLDLDLLFENRSLHMQGERVDVDGIQATNVTAVIPWLGKNAELLIDMDLQAEASDAADYLKNSPLKPLQQTFTQLQFEQGEVTGELKLQIPLKRKRPTVTGRVAFNGARMYLAPLQSRVSDLKGELTFKNDMISAHQLTGNWQGLPTQFSLDGARSKSDYHLSFDLKGDWPVDGIHRAYPMGWLSHLNGRLQWRGDLDLELKKGGEISYSAKAHSNLNGIEVVLPAPLGKKAYEPVETHVVITGDRYTTQVDVDSDERFATQLALDTTQGLQLTAARYDIGSSPSWGRKVTKGGQVIVVRADELELEPWLDWLQRESERENKGTGHAPPLLVVDVRVKQAHYRQQPLDNFYISYFQPSELWFFESTQLKGQIQLPKQPTLKTPIELKVERARLPLLKLPDNSEVSSEISDRASFSPLRMSCQDCHLGKYKLGRVYLWLPYQGKRFYGGKLEVQFAQHSRLKARLDWLPAGDNMSTALSGQIQSNSADKLMRDLGFKSPLQQTPFESKFNISWLGNPGEFNESTLNGMLNVKAGEGVLTEVSDKGARLFTLGSLDTLRRRLKLDFRDVFDQGLFFESAKANVRFSNGVASNSDFYMDAVAGVLRGDGQADFKSGKVDYEVSFSPKLTSSLPVLAAFTVTPVTGVAVLALSKLFEPVVEAVTQVRFQITGNMDKPELIEVERLQQKIKVPDEFQE